MASSSQSFPISSSGQKRLLSILKTECASLAQSDRCGAIPREEIERVLFQAIDQGLSILLKSACAKLERRDVKSKRRIPKKA